jgi:hypothetical protein
MCVGHVHQARNEGPIRLNEHGIEFTQAQLQTFLRVTFFEVGDSLASGEDVFPRGVRALLPGLQASPEDQIRADKVRTYDEEKSLRPIYTFREAQWSGTGVSEETGRRD